MCIQQKARMINLKIGQDKIIQIGIEKRKKIEENKQTLNIQQESVKLSNGTIRNGGYREWGRIQYFKKY